MDAGHFVVFQVGHALLEHRLAHSVLELGRQSEENKAREVAHHSRTPLGLLPRPGLPVGGLALQTQAHSGLHDFALGIGCGVWRGLGSASLDGCLARGGWIGFLAHGDSFMLGLVCACRRLITVFWAKPPPDPLAATFSGWCGTGKGGDRRPCRFARCCQWRRTSSFRRR
jgi:hypothetical protein